MTCAIGIWMFLSGVACGAVLVAGIVMALRPGRPTARIDGCCNDNTPDARPSLKEAGL